MPLVTSDSTVFADFLVTTTLAIGFLVIAWLYGRVVSGGGPLNQFKKKLLLYAFIFALGMVYLMMLVFDLQWPRGLLFPLIGLWAAIVGGIAWWRGSHT